MLEAAEGKNVKGSKDREEMLKFLVNTVWKSQQSGIAIDENNIGTTPALWNGLPVELDNLGQPDPCIVRETIWELYETNFRLELITMDRYLVPEPQGDTDEAVTLRDIWFDHQRLLNRCWPGHAYCPHYTLPGISCKALYLNRAPFIKGIFDLTKDWPGKKPQELCGTLPDMSSNFLEFDMEKVEKALVNYYVRMFAKIYHRPATIPHIASLL